MARPRLVDDGELERQIGVILTDNPNASMKQIRAAGIRGQEARVLEIVNRLKGYGPTPPPLPPLPPPIIATPMSPEEAGNVTEGWHHLQELLFAARDLEEIEEYRRSLQSLVAARNLLTSCTPLNVPGKGMLARRMTDKERIIMLAQVCSTIGKLEHIRATIDQMHGSTLSTFMTAFQRVLETEFPRGEWRRIYGRLKDELAPPAGKPLLSPIG